MKKTFLFLFLCLIILGSFYTTAWYYFAGVIDREVAGFIEDQKKQGVDFQGTISPTHGFPGVYKLVYTGDIVTPSGTLSFPKLEISGIPLEGMEMTALAPLGLEIKGVRTLPDHLQKLERAALTIIVPTQMPPELSYPYLKVWQANGNARFRIASLTLQWPDASIFAEGDMRLNEQLQPEGEATLGVTNHNYFVTILAEEIGMPGTQKLMLLTFLNALNKKNGAIILPLQIKENAFYLNMIRLSSIPFIHWPGTPFLGRERPDSPPALPQ